MTDTDYAIQLKLMRSLLHLKTIHRRIRRYLESSGNGIVNDFTSVPGYLIIRARTRRPPPSSLTVEIGEFLYNTRAALDYTACELARYNRESIDEQVEYPIFLDRSDFRNPASQELTRGVKRRIGKLAAVHQAIIERQQPFNRSDGAADDDPLWLLYVLSNHDRHQFIHLVSTITSESFHDFSPPEAAARFEQISVSYGAFENRAEVARFRIKDGAALDVNVESRVRFNVAFDEMGPGGGRVVTQTLGAIGVRVGEIIKDFNWATLVGERTASTPRPRGAPPLADFKPPGGKANPTPAPLTPPHPPDSLPAPPRRAPGPEEPPDAQPA